MAIVLCKCRRHVKTPLKLLFFVLSPGVLLVRLFARRYFVLSFYCVALFHYFVFSLGSFSSFCLFAWRLFVLSSFPLALLCLFAWLFSLFRLLALRLFVIPYFRLALLRLIVWRFFRHMFFVHFYMLLTLNIKRS